MIYNGGTMYIDEGKPLPGQFETTLKNIADVAVDSYTTVPAVYALLLDAMEKHDALRQRFFSKLEWCSYGGCGSLRFGWSAISSSRHDRGCFEWWEYRARITRQFVCRDG